MDSVVDGAAAGAGSPISSALPMRGKLGTFEFPSWETRMSSGQRDFSQTLRAYQARHADSMLTGQLAGRSAQQTNRQEVAEKQRMLDKKLAAQAQLHAEKLRKAAERFAEKERIRVVREREKEARMVEREAARLRAEEERHRKREELARLKGERDAERERLREERERGNVSRRRWLERSTLPDRELPPADLPPGTLCEWGAGEELSPGDLLMVWNFLCTHADALACPRVSLQQLRLGLLVPERSVELADTYVALLRVLLADMDSNPEMQTEPPRAELLTSVTWPYLACMYIEEHLPRLSALEDSLAEDLGQREFFDIGPAQKLQLLSLLCNECSGCEPVKRRLDDLKAVDIERRPGQRDRKTKHRAASHRGAAASGRAASQLLGLDRRRNRFVELLDEQGQLLVAVHVVRSSVNMSHCNSIPEAERCTDVETIGSTELQGDFHDSDFELDHAQPRQVVAAPHSSDLEREQPGQAPANGSSCNSGKALDQRALERQRGNEICSSIAHVCHYEKDAWYLYLTSQQV